MHLISSWTQADERNGRWDQVWDPPATGSWEFLIKPASSGARYRRGHEVTSPYAEVEPGVLLQQEGVLPTLPSQTFRSLLVLVELGCQVRQPGALQTLALAPWKGRQSTSQGRRTSAQAAWGRTHKGGNSEILHHIQAGSRRGEPNTSSSDVPPARWEESLSLPEHSGNRC